MKVLVLGLGNELIADDAAGIIAARMVREAIGGDAIGSAEGFSVDVVECSVSGAALLDVLAHYDKAIIIDAVLTGRAPPGTIHELDPSRLGRALAPSAHYCGLPEVLELAKKLSIPFPGEIAILAVEVADPYTIGAEVSASVRAALPELARRATARLEAWAAEA